MSSQKLPASGHPGIDWAARSMPLLAQAMSDLAPDFASRHVGICLHIEPKTGVLVSWLLHAGAKVTITGNLGTTEASTAAALADLGAEVIGSPRDDAAVHARNLAAVLATKPDILLDNGAEMIEQILRPEDRWPTFIGATEETTTGGRRLSEADLAPEFPVIVINDSYLKLLVENEFGVGQSVVQGFMNATNAMLPGMRAVVIGYGPCGKGVADTLALLGARVSVVDTNPYRSLEAIMRGHKVGTIADVIGDAQVIFLATGHPGVISSEQFDLLPDGVMLVGVGHEPSEVDLHALQEAAERVDSLSLPTGEPDARLNYALSDGRAITVLHGTTMINLIAAGGNPIQAMDLGLTLQARSLAGIVSKRVRTPGSQPVPADIDRQIATDLVALWS